MRWVVVFFVAMVGCVATLPDDPTITADLAVETARMAVVAVPEQDSGRCENCNGTGKIGDGKIEFDCPECGGTGEKAVVHPAAVVPCKECKL